MKAIQLLIYALVIFCSPDLVAQQYNIFTLSDFQTNQVLESVSDSMIQGNKIIIFGPSTKKLAPSSPHQKVILYFAGLDSTKNTTMISSPDFYYIEHGDTLYPAIPISLPVINRIGAATFFQLVNTSLGKIGAMRNVMKEIDYNLIELITSKHHTIQLYAELIYLSMKEVNDE